MKTKSVLLFILFGWLFSMNILANVNSDLNDFFNNLGYSSNVTNPSSYQNQQAGYYSAGSLYLRGKVRNLNPFYLQAPSLKTGCGGIDLFMGGMSFIHGQQLINFAQNIMSNAAPYFFNLALETYLPQIKNIMSELQYWAQQINQTNMNSCATAEALVGGLFPKSEAAQRQICQDLGTQSGGLFHDWAEARQGCGAGGQGDQYLANQSDTIKKEKGITQNVNVSWQAITQNGLFNTDNELAEFMMTLSGTVIFDNHTPPNVRVWPSLASENSTLVQVLLKGGDAQIYGCDEFTHCLNLHPQNINIGITQALEARVAALITSIQQKVEQDQTLTQAEQGFLASTQLPILKFITVSLESGTNLTSTDYIGLISEDILSQYLSDAMNTLEFALATSTYTEQRDQIEKGLSQARDALNRMRGSVESRTQAMNAYVAEFERQEAQVVGRLSNRLKLYVGG